MNETTPPPAAPQAAPPPSPPKRRKRRWRPLAGLPFLIFVALVLSLGAVFGPGPLKQDATIVVPHGTGARDIAMILDKSGAIYSTLLFRATAKFAAGGGLKAGEYQLTTGESMIDIVAMIHDGRSIKRLFTVAEGLTSAEVAKLVNATPTLGGDPVPVPPEGSLLPESYSYIYGDSRAGMIQRMQKLMQETLAEEWAKRDPGVALATPQDAVTMASIVEKETGKPAERPRIAAVFYNRLRTPMRLQSDPTVIYGIMKARGQMDHVITHDDLAFASPYNTYLNDGMPPGPICNPGKAAIDAVLHPEANDYLFFVADGTGGHVFARSLAEHNQNVTRWNEVKAGQK